MEPQQPEQPAVNQPAPEVVQSQPPAPIEPGSAEEPSATSPRKWLIIGGTVLVVILAAGVAVLGYQNFQARQQAATPTPTTASELPPAPPPVPSPESTGSAETANWEIYKNDDKGYQVKYPKTNLLRFLCPGEELILTVRTPANESQEGKQLETCGRDGRFDIEISTYDKSDLVFQTFGLRLNSDSDYSVTESDVQIAGLPAKKYIVVPTSTCTGICNPEWRVEIRLEKNEKIHTFHLWRKELSETFNQILSTFKFLE